MDKEADWLKVKGEGGNGKVMVCVLIQEGYEVEPGHVSQSGFH